MTEAGEFWSKVNSESLDGCWPWTGECRGGTGYGRFCYEYAHRIAWTIASGDDIPKGMDVLHTCDYRRCVRNDEPGIYLIKGKELPRFGHLALGTHLDNMRDARQKRRMGQRSSGGHELLRKLIRERGYYNGAVAGALGISPALFSMVLTGERSPAHGFYDRVALILGVSVDLIRPDEKDAA